MMKRNKRGTNRHTNNPQSTVNSILLPEIIFSILVRLPVYDLLQVKTVCKLWFDIVSSHEFAVASLEYWKSTPEIISLSKNNQLRYFLSSIDIRTNKEHRLCLGDYAEEDVTILNAVDGLVLFLVTGPTRTRILCICNPLTQKFNVLHYIPASWDKGDPVYILVFDQVKQSYKVIGFCYHYRDLLIDKRYCVLTLKSNEGRRCTRGRGDFRIPVWKNVENQFRHFSRLRFASITIGRILYWIAGNLTDKVIYIQTMDFVEEVFREKIPLPCQPDALHYGTCRLLEMQSRGSVYVVIPCNESELGIWLLKSGKDYKWIKQHNIILESVVGRPSTLNTFFDYRFEVLYALDTDDSNRMKLAIRYERELYTYNLKELVMTLVLSKSSTWRFVPSLISWE